MCSQFMMHGQKNIKFLYLFTYVQAGYAWAVADLSPLDFWEGDKYNP